MHVGRKLSLFVFIDALGWRLFERYGLLDDVLTERGPLETVFGYSSTCAPTILTGVAPREHGHFSFFRYAPDASPFSALRYLALLPTRVTGRARPRHWLSRVVAWSHGFDGYFQLYNVPFEHLPLFAYTETRDIYRPGGINGGQSVVFDDLRARAIPFHLSNWRASEEENLAALEAALTAREVAFAYLYLAALDALLHAEGTGAPSIEAKVAAYDRALRRVLDVAARRYDDVHLHLFSDHGQADVTATCDVMATIEALGLRFGVDYVALYDSTMARFWFLNARAERRIRAALARESNGRILTDDELQAWGCDFPERAYGELFFLMHPGVLLCPSFMGRKPLAAMHGYDPHDVDSVATFASNHPIARHPRGLGDMRALMQTEMDWLEGRGARDAH